MYLRDPPKTTARKELKVSLSARHHRALRAIRATTGQETPRIVADALGLYFERLARSAAAADIR